MLPLTRPANAGADYELQVQEWYNPTKYPLHFKRRHEMDQYVQSRGISLGPWEFVLQPDEFRIVSHGYYIGTCLGGSPEVTIIRNLGRTIGIGNKLPSPPIPELANEKA